MATYLRSLGFNKGEMNADCLRQTVASCCILPTIFCSKSELVQRYCSFLIYGPLQVPHMYRNDMKIDMSLDFHLGR